MNMTKKHAKRGSGNDNMLPIRYLSLGKRVPVASKEVPVASRGVGVASKGVRVASEQVPIGSECRPGAIDTGVRAGYLPAMTEEKAANSGHASVVQTKYTRTNAITRRLMDGYFKAFAELVAGMDIESAFEPGCGEGFSTKRIRSILPARVSLEASELDGRLVQSAVAANPGVVVRQESVYQIARQDKSVDLVILLEVLEHLDDPAKAMAEICRVSRKYVIVGVPREPLWCLMNLMRLKYVGGLGNTPGHIRHWSAGSFRRFVGRFADVREVRKPLPWTMVLATVR